MAAIVDIRAREILDSRGNPTVEADATAGVIRDGPGRGKSVARRHPHVEHPIARGQVGDLAAVGAELDRSSIRVAEEHRTWNQRRIVVGHLKSLLTHMIRVYSQ